MRFYDDIHGELESYEGQGGCGKTFWKNLFCFSTFSLFFIILTEERRNWLFNGVNNISSAIWGFICYCTSIFLGCYGKYTGITEIKKI